MEKWNINIVVTGQDARTIYTAQILEKNGYRVSFPSKGDIQAEAVSTKSSLKNAQIILGGIPFLEEERIVPLMQPGQLVFGGMLSEGFCTRCREKGIVCHDFMKEEALLIRNAIATAEGAIAEAIKNSNRNLHGSKCLVLGFGRCGSVLCHKLKGLSAEVVTASREDEELAKAESMGVSTLLLTEVRNHIQDFLFIFNTIPKKLIGRTLLENTREDVLFIDLASGEGGVDGEAAELLNRKALHCMGLPGKYAPASSAEYLAEYMMKKLS